MTSFTILIQSEKQSQQKVSNCMLVPPCRDGSSVGRLGQSPPLKPTTVSFFNIISYNSENNIRDIRPIFRPLFCHRRVVSIGCLSYPTAAKLLWVDKYYWNRPPPPPLTSPAGSNPASLTSLLRSGCLVIHILAATSRSVGIRRCLPEQAHLADP